MRLTLRSSCLQVMRRTARLVAQWQCVGFCHGVLNTDNMSILGLTLDYGPFGFMDRSAASRVWKLSEAAVRKHFCLLLRFDPNFICNASDSSGRYSYQAQPAICRWNLVKLAEALAPEVPPDRAEAVMDEYLDAFNSFYLANMRKKLGLLKKEEPEDAMLITELLQAMHNTGEVSAPHGCPAAFCGSAFLFLQAQTSPTPSAA